MPGLRFDFNALDVCVIAFMLTKGVSELVEREKGIIRLGWTQNNGLRRVKGKFGAGFEGELGVVGDDFIQEGRYVGWEMGCDCFG